MTGFDKMDYIELYIYRITSSIVFNDRKFELDEFFKKQLEQGATEMFFYGVELGTTIEEGITVSIRNHKGTLDSFPGGMEFIRMMSESTPLFKEV